MLKWLLLFSPSIPFLFLVLWAAGLFKIPLAGCAVAGLFKVVAAAAAGFFMVEAAGAIDFQPIGWPSVF